MRKLGMFLACFVIAAMVWDVILGAVICRLPRAVEDSPTGKHYAPYSTYVDGTEGFAKTVFDAQGYNDGPAAVKAKRPVLVLGDSHTEALQVPRSENFCSVAQGLLTGGQTVYNAGISGQSAADYINYGGALLKKFDPSEVVIQVTYPDFTSDATSASNNCEIVPQGSSFNAVKLAGTQSRLKNLKDTLVSLCAFNSEAYIKLEGAFSGLLSPARRPFLPAAATAEAQPDVKALAPLIDWEAAQLAATYGRRLVLLYLPYTPSLSATGGVVYSDPYEQAVKALIFAACKKYGIAVIDMQPGFDSLLKNKGVFARGFENTSPGEGHLNAQGHLITGERLAGYLNSLNLS